MATVAILPIPDADGGTSYRAVAGDRHSAGRTAGQALDALVAQLDETEFSGFFIIQNFRPDPLFSAAQKERLSELMSLWRSARDRGQELPPEQQAELDSLVEAELRAATLRTANLVQQETL